MSARKSRGTSRTPTDSPVTSDSGAFNNGDVIWAPYRKSPAWPSIVSRVYPKKLTYHFLPLLGDEVSKKTPAFSCDPKKARLFSESDQLPADATSDLVKAFKAARTLLGLESAKDSPLNSSKRNTSRSPLRQKPKGVEKKPVVEDDEKRSNATVDDDEEVDETDGFRHDDVVLIKMNNEPEWPAVIGQVFKKYVAFHFLPVTDKSKPRKVAKQHVRKLDVYQVAELIKKVEDEELRKALICAQKLVEVKADVDVIRSLTNGSDSNEA
uniref:PWWP domain-containing protein n=1 Tax=Plectus sambesii TaxID=2011161 RepID=A0A914URX8_9BILA